MIELAKKKQIIISEEELVPTTLAIIEDKKKASIFGIVWIFVIFVIFIVGVIYLPEISSYVNNYLNPDITEPNLPSNNNKNNNDNDNEKVEKKYTISNELVIKETEFKISNFNIENSKSITFKITNLTDEVLELKKSHYFINLYNDNKKLLQRIYLQEILSPNGETVASYTINDNNIAVISLVKILEADYPSYIVPVPENGTPTLTCTKDYEKIEYLFKDNKVYATNLIYEVNTNDVNFASLYSNFQLLQTTYNNTEGVSSSLEILNGVVNFKTIISLSSNASEKLNLKMVYPYETNAKIINFEMTANGYTCS